MSRYRVGRIWDDCGDWDDCGGKGKYHETVDAACAAAERHIDLLAPEGDYGQAGGETTVTVWYVVEDEDGDEVERHSHEAELAVDEDRLIREAGGDPDCAHEWTRVGEGGCDQNPGVWSLGGTTVETAEHCVHCGVRRVTTLHGGQRNPGEPDIVRYETPD